MAGEIVPLFARTLSDLRGAGERIAHLAAAGAHLGLIGHERPRQVGFVEDGPDQGLQRDVRNSKMEL